MKLAYFDDFKLGVVKGDRIVDVDAAVRDIPHTGPHNLISGLIEHFAEYRGKIEAAAKGQGVPITGVRLRPPVPKPTTIVCMAVNYMEDGTRSEPAPINAFLKSPSCIIGPGDTMELPDIPAKVFEGEAEFAVVIGKRAKNVASADAIKSCVRLHEFYRWIGARPASSRQHVLSDEITRHVCADRPIYRHG